MYNFTTYAMQLNELHEDQKSKVSHFPLLEKWRESSTVYSSVKMAGKYCNSCTVYSRPSSGREKSANRSNVCSRVYQNDGKNRPTGLLSAHEFIKLAGKISQSFASSSIKILEKISSWSDNMTRKICQIGCFFLASRNGGKNPPTGLLFGHAGLLKRVVTLSDYFITACVQLNG